MPVGLFGFANQIYGPHLVFGILAIGAGLFTETTPHTQTHGDRRDARRDQDIRHAH